MKLLFVTDVGHILPKNVINSFVSFLIYFRRRKFPFISVNGIFGAWIISLALYQPWRYQLGMHLLRSMNDSNLTCSRHDINYGVTPHIHEHLSSTYIRHVIFIFLGLHCKLYSEFMLVALLFSWLRYQNGSVRIFIIRSWSRILYGSHPRESSVLECYIV